MNLEKESLMVLLVKGRPTKGFGSSSFDYAGKLYKPTPWTHPMYKIKEKAEKLVWEELGINKKFTFCLCGYYAKTVKVYHIIQTLFLH